MSEPPRYTRRAVAIAGVLAAMAFAAWLHRPSSETLCLHVFELAAQAGDDGESATLDACVEQLELRFEERGPVAGRRMLRCIRRADHLLEAAGC